MRIIKESELKDLIVLINTSIHKESKLKKNEFLERIKYIENLRTTYNSNYISFYITSLREHNNLIKFHKMINEECFMFEDYKVFAVAIQPKLYNWFKTNSINTIQKQIICWLAGYHYFNPEVREIHKEQIYKPLYDEMLKLIDRYYKGFDFRTDNIDDLNKCLKKYLTVCDDFCGINQVEFLNTPFEYKASKNWENIIIKTTSQDTMCRVESFDNLWHKWKHTFTMYEETKSFVYNYYFENSKPKPKKSEYLRESIPQKVKEQVWQRDCGKCVECDSNEKLEFDHIIPVSKGGATTYRNLQLLCESCNRKKSNKI